MPPVSQEHGFSLTVADSRTVQIHVYDWLSFGTTAFPGLLESYQERLPPYGQWNIIRVPPSVAQKEVFFVLETKHGDSGKFSGPGILGEKDWEVRLYAAEFPGKRDRELHIVPVLCRPCRDHFEIFVIDVIQ